MPAATCDATPRTALTIGSEVPVGDFAFRVHSMFESALNLRVDGRRLLVTLVGPAADHQPQSIRLASHERFDAWPVRPGDPGRRAGHRLAFESVATGGRPSVDLGPAAVSGRVELAKLDPRSAALGARWAECACWLDVRQEQAGAELRLGTLWGEAAPVNGLGGRLADAGRSLGDAVRAGDVDAAALAAARVIGLGTGLTPSGDDFLCGLLAALWSARIEGTEDARFLAGWGARLATGLEATNLVSATLLECAIAGSFCGAVCDLAVELSRSRPGDGTPALAAAMARLCAMGHSSGMDIATGFLFGLWLRSSTETRRDAPSI